MRDPVWIGSSREDLRDFPKPVMRVMGFALVQALLGGKHASAKPLKGFQGARVLEIAEDFGTDTYRLVYTVEFDAAIYVLHAWKKKSTRGIATAKRDLDSIAARRARAITDAASRKL